MSPKLNAKFRKPLPKMFDQSKYSARVQNEPLGKRMTALYNFSKGKNLPLTKLQAYRFYF